MRENDEEGMLGTCLVWALLSICCMAVMLTVASRKTIVIADTAQNVTEMSAETTEPEEIVTESELLMHKSFGVTGQFFVALPKGTRAENVVMENRYIEKELWLHISKAAPEIQDDCQITGDITPILQGRQENQKQEFILKLSMDRIYEYRSTLENDVLSISWAKPDEMYETVVVLCPMDAVSEAGDTATKVAKLVQDNIRQENVKIYIARDEGGMLTDREVLEFVSEVGANMYVGLRMDDYVGNPDLYGIRGIYNEEYYIPDLGNPEVANVMTAEVTMAANNRAVGLFLADKTSVLRLFSIPSCEVSLGNLANEKECYLLQQDTYREKLAQGIINGIAKTIEMKQKEN